MPQNSSHSSSHSGSLFKNRQNWCREKKRSFTEQEQLVWDLRRASLTLSLSAVCLPRYHGDDKEVRKAIQIRGKTRRIGVKLAPHEEKRRLLVVSAERLKLHGNIFMTALANDLIVVQRRIVAHGTHGGQFYKAVIVSTLDGSVLFQSGMESTAHGSVTDSSVTRWSAAAPTPLRQHSPARTTTAGSGFQAGGRLVLTRRSDCMTTADALPGGSESVASEAPTQ